MTRPARPDRRDGARANRAPNVNNKDLIIAKELIVSGAPTDHKPKGPRAEREGLPKRGKTCSVVRIRHLSIIQPTAKLA